MATNESDRLRHQIEELQGHITKLSRAFVRISANLGIDSILKEIVDSARDLTGARFSFIMTVDEECRPRRFVGSPITAGEYRQMTESTDGRRLFEYLTDPRTRWESETYPTFPPGRRGYTPT